MDERLPKSEWGPGAWQFEADEYQFEHAGLLCLMRRSPIGGNWCGYVGVPHGHPLHGLKYSEASPHLQSLLDKRMNEPMGENPSVAVMLGVLSGKMDASPDQVLDVHGGITYSNLAHRRIGEKDVDGVFNGSDHRWYFGFDCGHCDDFAPAMVAELNKLMPDHRLAEFHNQQTYRNAEYVMGECRKLAEQLAALSDRNELLLPPIGNKLLPPGGKISRS